MTLTGKAVSRGIAIGTVLRYVPFAPVIKEAVVAPDQISQAVAEYQEAMQRAYEELDRLENRLAESQPDQAKIVSAHKDILMDPAMIEEIEDLIRDSQLCPNWAIAQVYQSYAEILSVSSNKLMQERAADLRDVMNRLLRCLEGASEQNLSSLSEPVIVVADDLYPSDTAAIDRECVLGIITQVGGATSHTAIIARSYQIPAVLGVPNAMDALQDGQRIILDGERGEIHLSPSVDEIAMYREKSAQVERELQEENLYLETESVTRDGFRVQVRMNVAAITDQELNYETFTDGCGLFRTEFLYLNSSHLPTEEEQYQVYSKVLEAFAGKPVILRTMDIGGDKQVPCMELPHEENPFLGLRGLRLSLSREELLRIQIRAALRASVHGYLKIMFPMVGSLDEIRYVRYIVEEEKRKLDQESIQWSPSLQIGIMIEVPSVAMIAELVAKEVDFVSVGTNDLTQYLCAADRMNPQVRRYYQEYHPAVFRVLAHLSKTFQAAGKDISICGELGGDPLALPVLLGMGINQFSMGSASLARAKRTIRSLDMESAKNLARQVLTMGTQEEITACLQKFFREQKEMS